jgi:hypothetical protein
MKKPSNADNKKRSKAWLSVQLPKSVSVAEGVHGLKKAPAIVGALDDLVEPEMAGNPMNAEKWIRSSLQHLSKTLKEQGHAACPNMVGRLLKDLKYSLKANVKQQAGSQHPDCNTPFEYIETQKRLFLNQGWPIVSLDGKRRSNWQFQERWAILALEAEVVNDFETESQGRAVPYGPYDVNHNRGYVYIGQSADTAEFAVDVLSGWWQQFGQVAFPNASAFCHFATAVAAMAIAHACGKRNFKKNRQMLSAWPWWCVIIRQALPNGIPSSIACLDPSASIEPPNQCT